jgi:hypothetical protein
VISSDHSERFQQIIKDYLERPGGDYGELLTRGQVSSPEGTDPELWRAEIRAKARKDKIRVATHREGDRAFAMRHRNYSDAEVRAELERGWQLERLGERARDLGHELVGWIRSDNESVTFCGRCDARLYVHTGDAAPVSDGDALTLPCPGA